MNQPLHFINLTNGMKCLLRSDFHIYLDSEIRYLRLQSTHCEQHLWEKVLQNLGPEFFMAVARGAVIVHDVSERTRETRAMWLGLSWVRFALSRNWYGERIPSFIPRGMNLQYQWEEIYRSLSKPSYNNLKYYRKYVVVERVQISSCWGTV